MCCELPDVRGRHVVLGVTGGIAVYKSCEIVSRLRKLGVETHVIMTKNAAQFVQPLTFETCTYLPAKHLANFLIIFSCKVLAVDFHKNIACLQAYGSRRHMFVRFGYHGTLQFGIPGYDRADTAIRILQHLFQFALVVFRKILRIGVK